MPGIELRPLSLALEGQPLQPKLGDSLYLLDPSDPPKFIVNHSPLVV